MIIFIPVLAPVVVPLPPLPLPPRQNYLRVRNDAQTQWRIRVNRSQWGLGLNASYIFYRGHKWDSRGICLSDGHH